jgi:hypothetical protein
VQRGNEIGVNFQLPGETKKLTVAGKQKNIRKDRESVSIGVEFVDTNIELQERLYNFLSVAGA